MHIEANIYQAYKYSQSLNAQTIHNIIISLYCTHGYKANDSLNSCKDRRRQHAWKWT